MINQRKKLTIIIFAIMAIALIFFISQYISLKKQLVVAQQTAQSQNINKKVLAFSQLFVTNVLQGGQTVSFDDRLQLENAVRDIKDAEIYGAWQKFTNAKDQAEIQSDFSTLFQLLLKKIAI